MKKPTSIIVLGGGTAGWMAAILMAHRWGDQTATIQLIESPDIGIIGVGEGSTPQLKAFFDELGVSEAEWMPQCNATYKAGITFREWSAIPGFESYFHPFPARTDRDTAQAFVYNCFLRRENVDVDVCPDDYFLPAWLARHRLGPIAGERFPFPVSYGYHFDSHLVGEFLRRKAESLGVITRQDNIEQVVLNDAGDIAELIGEQGDRYAGEVFIDATGFRSMLLQQALQVEFDSFSDALYNDSAVVLPTCVAPDQAPNSQTIATAMRHGWRWDIPLTHRTGNGYVYSSQFCSADDAEAELREALDLVGSDTEARHLKMRVGQVRQHWHRNCLAVGLSQGFLEPLEATALHLVQETIQRFMYEFERGEFSTRFQTDFNQQIRGRFEGIRDYIVAHYKLNSRSDTPYWVACRESPRLSESLKRLLHVWQSNGDLAVEIEQQGIGQYYSAISWHCLLAGYGIFPHTDQLKNDDQRAQRFEVEPIREFNRRCALNFASHEQQLATLLN